MTWCSCARKPPAPPKPCPPRNRYLRGAVDADHIGELMEGLGKAAVDAAAVLALAPTRQKNEALAAAAATVRARRAAILAANERDMSAARAAHLSGPRLERLRLDERRIETIGASIDAVIALPDPIGSTIAEWERPNGLKIQRVVVPLGVIGIIYESRPNVTADAGALCLKSGNAAILRGGSESQHSSRSLHECLAHGLQSAGLPAQCIQLVPVTDRAAVGYMLAGMSEYLDVIVPRGGKTLVERVQKEARVPVIGHLEGNCHVYIDRDADVRMARTIALNAKMRRTRNAAGRPRLRGHTPGSDRARSDRCRLRGARRCHGARGGSARAPGERGGLVHRVPRRDHRRARGRGRGCGHRAHRALRLRAHRIDRHREPRHRRALPAARRQRHRAA